MPVESGGRLKKSLFTVFTVPCCDAQKTQLADCVSNPHASGRRLYVTELVQRRIGTKEDVTLLLKEPEVISVPAGCSVRVASVPLICSRTGTDDARSYDAHFMVETRLLDSFRSGADQEPQWGTNTYHYGSGCEHRNTMRGVQDLSDTTHKDLKAALEIVVQTPAGSESPLPTNWRVLCAAVTSS
jgi:hypothetical protein